MIVNNGDELKDTLLMLVNEGVEEATLTTDVYDGDVEEDFDRAVRSIKNDYLAESYMVDTIQREIVSAGSYSRIDLEIEYLHEKSEVPLRAYTMDELQRRMKEALSDSEDTLTMRVFDYEDLDFSRIAKEYAENNLTAVIAEPEFVSRKTFPREGSERIVELRFSYPKEHNDLISRKQFVDYMIASSVDSVSGLASGLERARQLYALQIGGHSYSEESGSTPAFDLFVDRKGDSRVFSAVYQAMCAKSEVNCHLVHGTKDGEPYDWNILELDSGVWHVDVNADAQSGAAELRLMTDDEMEGYVWDKRAYPACVGLYAPVEPPKNEEPPAEGEQSQEQPNGQPEPAPEPPEEETPNKPENTP